MVLSVSVGSLLGGIAGDKVFSALTGSFDNHLVKAVLAGVLAAVYSLAIIFLSKLSKLMLSATCGALWAVDLTVVPFIVIPAIADGFIGTHSNRKLSEEGMRKIYVFVMALLPLISLYNCVANVLAL